MRGSVPVHSARFKRLSDKAGAAQAQSFSLRVFFPENDILPTALQHGYPRPQLQRSQWTSLNGTWRFRFDDSACLGCPADVQEWPLEIVVPFPPESKASGIGDRGFHKACWYERDIACKPGKDRVILHFGAIDYSARVWVNGQLAATHEGGHTPFQAAITEMLKADGKQVVTVRAEDDPQDLTKPRGKQDWQLEPHSIWYPRTTGIWQTVWLERVHPVHIEKIRWTPKLEGFQIGLEAHIAGDTGDDASLELELRVGERLLAKDRYRVVDGEVDRYVVLSDHGIDHIRNDKLWS